MPEGVVWISPLFVILWIATSWRQTIPTSDQSATGPAFFGPSLSLRRVRAVLILMVVAAIGTGLSAPSLWTAIGNGYPGDSLFTLEPAEIAGVIAISLVLIALFFWLLTLGLLPLAKTVADKPLARAAAALVCLAGSLLVFGVSHTVSPQIYYTFYRMIIPDLPDQWVIRTWLDRERLAGAAALTSDGSLSAHLTGVTFWCVGVLVMWIFAMRWTQASWQASPIVIGVGCAALLALIRIVPL